MVVAMPYKERISVVVILFVLVKHVCVYWYIYIFLYVLTVSSPYLLVFGNDRVRGTCEHVMMQVELVRLSYKEGIAWGFYFMILNQLQTFMFLNFLFYNWRILVLIFIIDIWNKDLNFPYFGKWGIINCDVIILSFKK